MHKTINWGIIGLGKIANKFAEDLLLLENTQLYGVASRDLKKSNVFGKRYGATKCYGSYEGLSKDPDVDIIYVATPHVFHFENTMMCLENGKSVLCEKPLGMNAHEVKTMIKKAKSRNLFLMEAMWTRFIPGTEELLKLLNGKAIGELNKVQADFGFMGDKTKHRLYKRELGGGSLLDVGIYPVYLSLLALGVPDKINATARFTSNQIDSFCEIQFSYKNKEKAFLESSIESTTPTEAYLHGDKGLIKIHTRFHHPEKFTISLDDRPDVMIDIPYIGNGYYHEIVEVMTCIERGETESEKMPHAQSLDLIKTLDLIRGKIGLTYECDN